MGSSTIKMESLGEKIDFMLKLRASANDRIKDYADKFGKLNFIPVKDRGELKLMLQCLAQLRMKFLKTMQKSL